MFAICRIEKLKTGGNIGGLNSHITRTMDVPNADPSKTHLNYKVVGTDNLNSDVSRRIQAANITPRKNAVLAVEHLLTASPEYFKNGHEDFVKESSEWLNERYGKENVVNVTVHLDESTPHIHAIIVPIDQKGKLNARDFFGGRQKMTELQDSFASKVEHLGLVRGVKGSKAEHVTIKEYYSLLNSTKESYQLPIPGHLDRLSPEQWIKKQNEAINHSSKKTNISTLQEVLNLRNNVTVNHMADRFDRELKAEKDKYQKESFQLKMKVEELKKQIIDVEPYIKKQLAGLESELEKTKIELKYSKRKNEFVPNKVNELAKQYPDFTLDQIEKAVLKKEKEYFDAEMKKFNSKKDNSQDESFGMKIG